MIASHYLAAYGPRPDAPDAAEIKAKARRCSPRRRARRVARRGRRGAALLRAGGASSRTSRSSEAALLDRAGEMAGSPETRTRRGSLLEESIELHEQRGRHARRCARLVRLGALERFTGQARRGGRADGARVRGHLGRRAGRGPGAAGGRAARARTGSAAISSGPPSAPSSRSTSPRRRLSRRPLVGRAPREGGGRLQPRPQRGGARAAAARARVALEHELVEEAGIVLLHPLRHCFRRDAYADALGYLDESLALARKLGTGRTSGRAGGAHVCAAACSAAGTRCWR